MISRSSRCGWACLALSLTTLPLLLPAGGCAPTRVVAPPSSASPLLGRPLPSLGRRLVSGGRLDVAATRGRLVVVELFAQYCAPCQQRLPEAAALARDFPDVVVIGISLDESLSAAQAQVRRHRLPFPVIHDAGGVLAGRLRVTQLPVALVAGRDGRIIWYGGPAQPPAALRQAVMAARQGALGPRP